MIYLRIVIFVTQVAPYVSSLPMTKNDHTHTHIHIIYTHLDFSITSMTEEEKHKF